MDKISTTKTVQFALIALCGFALLPRPAAAKAQNCAPDAVSTRHTVTTESGTLAYKACVGTLPVANLAGARVGKVFYTAYFAGGSEPRPLTFVWNGGPGSDSRLLQFRALGPRVLRGGKLAENPVTLLRTSDLVFVDPVGTAFSTAQEGHEKDFFGTRADIASIADFVVSFRHVYRRTGSPTYLAGESFGTWRAAGVAETLVAAGYEVAGILLISGGIPLGDTLDRARMRALSLDGRTATALALGKLAPELQADPKATLAAARQWASETYARALADPAALSSDERQDVIAHLARFQGVQPDQIDPATLWLSPREFRTKLLAGRTLGIFDMRKTSSDETDSGPEVLAYYRNALNYRVGRYIGIEAPQSSANGDWQYDQAPTTKESLARAIAGEGPPSPPQPWLDRAFGHDPDLRVFVATGLFDSLNSCDANAAAATNLPVLISARFVLACYEGGHMMYDDPAEMERFANDVSAFVLTGA